MAFYNREGKKLRVDLENMEQIKGGYCSKVYHNSDIIFKEYYPATSRQLRLSIESFDFLRNVNNPHFIELYDIFCNYDFFELMSYLLRRELFKVDGYTAKFYSDDSVNVLLEHKDYLLDNLKELEELINFFSENRVLIDDLKRENTILGREGIVIIDPDLFVVDAKLSNVMDPDVYSFIGHKTNISIENKRELLGLINDLFICALSEIDGCSNDLRADSFFNFDVRKCNDITSEVSKRLQLVKKPIDYIVK